LKTLTRFGKSARKHRIDLGITLRDMADALGVSAAMLSAVENGAKPVPTGWFDRLPDELIRAHLLDALDDVETRRVEVVELLEKYS
jgi:transcriptional regulator with XRE-family HTH domain